MKLDDVRENDCDGGISGTVKRTASFFDYGKTHCKFHNDVNLENTAVPVGYRQLQ